MESDVHQSTQVIFILLTFFLLGATVLAARKISGERKHTMHVFLVLFFWLSFLKIISGMNFLHDYSSLPPRLLIAPLPCLVAILILAFTKKISEFLKSVPMHWLIYIQSFRIVMELILYALAKEGIIHERMTFAGSNFDILVGIFALPIGYLVQKKGGKLSFTAFCFQGLIISLYCTSVTCPSNS